ncbi:GNAT family N-acetyltransferase [Peribacillus frigoritolerans]|uniref:GNAT family N-acetyltransferase n=1 Tax=Peribacillus frigoritolerans TaxID=450367 RepID=UPI00301AA7E9
MEHFELYGKHVILTPMMEHHIEPLYAASLPSEIWEWSATKILSYEEAISYVKEGIRAREQELHHPFVVIDRTDDSVVGSTSLRNIHFHNQSLEIGATWYHPDKWRTAINTECKYLLLQHAFEKWQLKRVEFRTDECNKRSRAAITRLGALEEGILRMEKKLQDGRIRNTVVYSILEHEWPSVKRNLEAFLER